MLRIASLSSRSLKAASPAVSARAVARPSVMLAMRHASSATTGGNKPAPEDKAQSILSKLPLGTGTVTLGVAGLAAATSMELFVLNEEVVILGSFVIFLGYVAGAVRGPYTEWANGQIEKVKSILNTARAGHTDAVKGRIESVGEMKDVEGLTKSLFELSKQTAKLEHETFTLKQQAALAADIKAVLDSHVRHEAQVREAEQRELVETVLANVQKQIGDKKLQRDILLAGVAEIEGLVKNKAI